MIGSDETNEWIFIGDKQKVENTSCRQSALVKDGVRYEKRLRTNRDRLEAGFQGQELQPRVQSLCATLSADGVELMLKAREEAREALAKWKEAGK